MLKILIYVCGEMKFLLMTYKVQNKKALVTF